MLWYEQSSYLVFHHKNRNQIKRKMAWLENKKWVELWRFIDFPFLSLLLHQFFLSLLPSGLILIILHLCQVVTKACPVLVCDIICWCHMDWIWPWGGSPGLAIVLLHVATSKHVVISTCSTIVYRNVHWNQYKCNNKCRNVYWKLIWWMNAESCLITSYPAYKS